MVGWGPTSFCARGSELCMAQGVGRGYRALAKCSCRRRASRNVTAFGPCMCAKLHSRKDRVISARHSEQSGGCQRYIHDNMSRSVQPSVSLPHCWCMISLVTKPVTAKQVHTECCTHNEVQVEYAVDAILEDERIECPHDLFRHVRKHLSSMSRHSLISSPSQIDASYVNGM